MSETLPRCPVCVHRFPLWNPITEEWECQNLMCENTWKEDES